MKLKNKFSMMALSCTVLFMSCSDEKAQPAWPVGDNPFYNKYETPFEVPPFEKIRNEHFMPAFEAAMKLQKEYIEQIVAEKSDPTFENTLVAFEKSNELLNRVASVFFNLTSANTSPELEEINAKISPILAKHSDDIYMNAQLFAKIETVFKNQASLQLNGEQTELLSKTHKSFIRSGIALDAQKQQRLREINEKLSTLTVKFGQNLLAENNKFQLIIEDKNDLKGLPASLITAAEQAAKDRGMENKWVFTLHNPSSQPFLQYADNRALREKMYKAYTNKGNNQDEFDTSAIVSEIVMQRLERAQLLGYENHAAYTLEETMAKTPEKVNDFLAELWTPALEVAKKEAAQMQELMNKTAKGQKLEAWDWQYYAEKVRQEQYKLDAEEVKPYFKLEAVRDGIFTLCNKLYDLTFVEIKDIPKYHADVVAYEVRENEQSVGVLFMDFHPRASKRSGAWMTSYRKTATENGKRVTPLISIVCNFTPPSGETPALLTEDEVTTFFHEFGHALHGLLGNTQYRSLSGTSVPRDFVELPSQIMENWAFEPEMLALYAKHYKTGELIPAALVKKMEDASKFNQGFATVEYLAASILDMRFHGLTDKAAQTTTPEIKTENITPNSTLDIAKFEKENMDGIGLLNQIAPRYRSTYFQHIFSGGYSAGYYSYIWSGVLDTDAFAAFKESGDIFNKEIAKSFRKNILEKGGTDDPMTLYKNFRGQEPNVKYLLKKRGLETPTPQ